MLLILSAASHYITYLQSLGCRQFENCVRIYNMSLMQLTIKLVLLDTYCLDNQVLDCRGKLSLLTRKNLGFTALRDWRQKSAAWPAESRVVGDCQFLCSCMDDCQLSVQLKANQEAISCPPGGTARSLILHQPCKCLLAQLSPRQTAKTGAMPIDKPLGSRYAHGLESLGQRNQLKTKSNDLGYNIVHSAWSLTVPITSADVSANPVVHLRTVWLFQ